MKRRWKSVHHTIRKPIVLVVGIFFCLAALATGWLPGPGGIPLFLIGIAILASEFAWAERVKDKIMAVLHIIFAWFRAHTWWGALIIISSISVSIYAIYRLYFA